ncbi:MAG: hypothetical protein ACOX4F_07455 [Atopobiaceae bacterium]|jgi:polyhydroxyalkanoate synthesis regulator phasin
MAEFDPMDVVRKTFLAGVGAVATGAEKSQEIVSELVKKGELTVAQGKALNEELTHKAADVLKDTDGALLRSRLKDMSADERAAYLKKVQSVIDDLDTQDTTVDAEVSEVEDADGAADAEDEAKEK